MRAPAAGVAGGLERFARAGQLGQLGGVRLDQLGAGGDPAAQGLAAGVQEYGYAGRAGGADEDRVRAHGHARRQAAAQGHRVGAGHQGLVAGDERRPLRGIDQRARLVELRGVAGGLVDHGQGAARGARAGDQGVHHAGGAGEQVPYDRAGAAAREAGRRDRVAERGQDAGDVEAFAAGSLGHGGGPVRGVRNQPRYAVGDVECGIERHGQDHGKPRSRCVPGSCQRPPRRPSPRGGPPPHVLPGTADRLLRPAG